MAPHQTAERKDASCQIGRAVVDTRAAQADCSGVKGQGAVGIADDIALLVGVKTTRYDGIATGIGCPHRGAAVAHRAEQIGIGGAGIGHTVCA